MFGNHIELSYDKEKTHKTRFGGFLTVLLTILSIFAVYYFGREVIYRRNPSVSSAETYSSNSKLLPTYFEGNSEGIMLAIQVYDSLKENSLNEQIQFSAFLHLKSKFETIQVQVSQVECLDNKLTVNTDSYEFKNMICFKFSNDARWQENVGKLELVIRLKDNASYSSGIINVIFIEAALDLTNYENPCVNYLTSRAINFQTGNLRTFEIQMKQNYIETDTGIIFQSIDTISYLKPTILSFAQAGDDTYMGSTDPQAVVSLGFTMDQKIYKTARNYQKFQDFLSSVGGIIKMFSIMFVFISKKFTKLDFYMNLLNQIFNFQDEDSEETHHKDEHEEDDREDGNQDGKIQAQQLKQKQSSTNYPNSIATQKQNESTFPLNCQVELNKRQSFNLGILEVDGQKQLLNETKNIELVPIQKSQEEGGVDIKDTCKIEINLDEQTKLDLPPTANFIRKKKVNNTMLISKFMHKIQSLLHESNVDENKIEKIKGKLNEEGNQYIQPENKPLKWGVLDYLQNLFCFGKAYKKREQMKFCWRKVKERLNAVYLMQKLVELEKLKILLLDENQLKLFDYLPKPMISLDCEESRQTERQTQVIKKQSTGSSSSGVEEGLREVAQGKTEQIIKKSSCFGCLNKPDHNKKQDKKDGNQTTTACTRSQGHRLSIVQHAFHQKWIQLNARSTPLEKALNAMEAFEIIKEKEKKSAIDIKLVDMLDERMKKCFESANTSYEHISDQHQDPCDQDRFHQFFDGDNTIREFLYPSLPLKQEEQLNGQRRRANSLKAEHTPLNNTNFYSNQNNYSNSRNCFNSGSHKNPFTPVVLNYSSAFGGNTRMHQVPPYRYHEDTNGFHKRGDSPQGFSRYYHEYNRFSVMDREGIQQKSSLFQQRQLSPQSNAGQNTIKHILSKQKSSFSVTSHGSSTENATAGNKNNKPSLFSRKNLSEDNFENHIQRLRQYEQQQQAFQDIASKSGSIHSSPSRSDPDCISPSIPNIFNRMTFGHQFYGKPMQQKIQRQLSAKNLNFSGIDSELNTIEEDIPQENNTPKEMQQSKNKIANKENYSYSFRDFPPGSYPQKPTEQLKKPSNFSNRHQ